VQTYTWLAQCFLDKGVPEAAIRWYEKALKIPDWTTRHDWRSAMSWVRLANCERQARGPAPFYRRIHYKYRLSRRGRAHTGS